MAPLPPEYEIKEPKGYVGQIFPREDLTIIITAEPGIEDYLNSLEVYFALGDVDVSPTEVNFKYSSEFKEYTLNTASFPSNIASGTGICKVGEKQTTFTYVVP